MIFICSVSDLLDFINPNQDSRGRDSEAAKRRNLGIKVSNTVTQNAKWAALIMNSNFLLYFYTK
jgi:hypothetical protein